MKLIYQQMLSFFFIIIMSAAIIGYSVLNFQNDQAYSSTFSRLNDYTESMSKVVVQPEPNDSKTYTLDTKFLDQFQMVLANEDVSLRVFDNLNQQVYPKSTINWKLSDSMWKKLKAGKTIEIKNDQEGSSEANINIGNKEAYSWVVKPWQKDGKLLGVVLLGAKVTNIEKPITQAKNNLLVAVVITMIVGLMLSFFLASYTVRRITRLSKATKQVAAGDFDVKIPHKDSDEIDELATDFNSMVQSLKSSNDEIARQEERRNQFLADAAHEMRTPLTTINGILEGLQYDAIPEDSKEKSIELMRGETDRLIRLVNENLDYEKIRNNQILLFKSEFDAVPVIENIKTQLEKNATEHHDVINLTGDASALIYADHDRLTQVVFNIVQNAIQFTQNGTITIDVKRLEHSTKISVSDTGIGMDEEQQHFIFDRFYKADESRKKVGTGESGLGLAIVLSLVQQHGGLIDVQSTAGVGTTFTVEFFDDGFQKFKETKKENS